MGRKRAHQRDNDSLLIAAGFSFGSRNLGWHPRRQRLHSVERFPREKWAQARSAFDALDGKSRGLVFCRDGAGARRAIFALLPDGGWDVGSTAVTS